MDVSLTPSIQNSRHLRALSKSPTPRSPTSQPTSHPTSHPNRSEPVAIRDRPSQEQNSSNPPPPLPPPRHIEELGLVESDKSIHSAGVSTGGGASMGTPEALGTYWRYNSNPHWKGFSSESPNYGQPERQKVLQLREEAESMALDAELDPTRRASTLTVRPITVRRATDGSTIFNEDDRRPSVSLNGYRLHSERQLEQRSLDDSSNAYDRNLLSKIGGPKTPSPHRLSIPDALNVFSPTSAPERQASGLKRLSVPARRPSSLDTSALQPRWGSMTSLSAANNTATAQPVSPGSFRSPNYDGPEFTRPRLVHRNSSMTSIGSSSHRGSCDSGLFSHEEFPAGEGQLRDLDLNDRSPGGSDELHLAAVARAGMKRRASSPHRETSREDRSSVGSAVGVGDFYHRRSLQHFPNNITSASRYPNSQYGSISSASSLTNRTGSLASSYRPSISSSVTSLASGKLSPHLLSPGVIDPELNNGSFFPFQGSKSSAPSPRASLSNPNQHLVLSELATAIIKEPLGEDDFPSQTTPLTNSSTITMTSSIGGMYICDCCPKKPKKFATEEDLRLHHMEKQYTCAYCSNRFKNKNEAERHQNSLHLRRHSWSCAALLGAEHAFHTSPTNGGATDGCGFCGEEFPNPPRWDLRRDHLSVVHKFGECNQAKKFFRADHFRQHLKHSHAGTSGKWTNQLETACMRDEPPPIPMNRGVGGGSMSMSMQHQGQAYGSGHGSSMSGASGASGIKPETIDENPHE